MHDIRLIRDDPDAFDKALARRGLSASASVALGYDRVRREAVTELQTLQQRRNEASKQIGAKKKAGDHEGADALMAEVAAIKDKMASLEDEQKKAEGQLEKLLAGIPNLLEAEVPDGPDESANVEIRSEGEKRNYAFTPKDHVALGEGLGLDFEAGAKLSGARFVVLRRHMARLERALANFMLDTHTSEFGYAETVPPVMVRDHVMYGTGQLPKFEEDLYKTTGDFWLIPTSEVPLTNLGADTIYAEDELPLRMTAYTPCFRAEAGAAGRDTRGMIRMHQFSKVELVSIAHPDHSNDEHERMLSCAEEILRRLGLAWRVMVLSSGDTGFGARKTYDIEVWLPGQNDGQGQYREISSCSNCGDFQARRMKARFRRAGEKQTELVHTLNGSGLAIGRTMIAILETYQNEDGSVTVPEALRSYMGGLDVLRPES